MATSYFIRDWDLFTLFNYFLSFKSPIFHVTIPYLKHPLFHIQLFENSATIRCNYSFGEYNQQLAHLQNQSIFSEILSYNDLKETFIQSGILPYPNLQELLVTVQNLSNRDIIRGDRPLFLGLDTNLYRDRFYTTQYHWLKKLPRNKIGLMLSPHVKGELRVSYKYTDKHIRRLRNACAHSFYQKYISDFINQNRLEDRQKRLGFEETEKINHIHWIIVLPWLKKEQLQENEDQNIILNYELAVQERNIDLILLSRDKDFIDMAHGISGIHTLLLETPSMHIAQNAAPSWYNLAQFIYVLAVQFGMIVLENKEVSLVLQGIWRGKNGEDWDNESLKLTPQIKNKAMSEMIKNLKIIKAMNWQYE